MSIACIPSIALRLGELGVGNKDAEVVDTLSGTQQNLKWRLSELIRGDWYPTAQDGELLGGFKLPMGKPWENPP